MRNFWRHFRGALRRLFPEGLTHAQAVAFSMFLAFLPMLLFVLGLLSSSPRLGSAVQELLYRVRWVLPPGTRGVVSDHLTHSNTSPMQLMMLGLWGTFLIGAQVMTGLMEGFRLVYGIRERPGFWRQQARALLLLAVTLGPFLATVLVTVFGRQVRGWMITQFGLPRLFQALWLLVYLGLALVMAALILVLVYRAGCTACSGWNDVLPGALLATGLLWLVNTGFGFYVRHVPYSIIYGGLAAAIGLMVWMYLCIVIVFIGAAFNAERAANFRATPAPSATSDQAQPASATRS